MSTAFELKFASRTARAFPSIRGIPRLAAVRPRGVKREIVRYDISDFLAELGAESGERGAGVTKLQELFAGAMREVGIHWDARQVTVHLPWGSYTRIDFVIWHPRTAIYPNGPVHDLRPDVAWRDKVIDQQLRSEGWKVARIPFNDIMEDPKRAAMQILYAQ